jgi:hypothetical protein
MKPTPSGLPVVWLTWWLIAVWALWFHGWMPLALQVVGTIWGIAIERGSAKKPTPPPKPVNRLNDLFEPSPPHDWRSPN